MIQCPTNITVWLCSTNRPGVTCPTPSSTPIRPASVGNGLFYDSEVEPDLTLVQFNQAMFANAEDGHHPIHVNAYQGASGIDTVDFAAAWVQDDDSAFPYGYAPSATVAQLAAMELGQAPLRPISLSGFKLSANDTRFAVAYLNDGAAFSWRLILDKDFNQYQAEIEDLADQGYRPICVSGYSHNDQNARFSGIFVKDGLSGANWVTSHGIPEAGYQEWFDQWWNDGFRPVSLSAYTVGSQTFFTAVMVRLPGSGTIVASHGITEADFLNLNSQWTSLNNPHGEIFRPVVVAAYRSQFQGGVKRYAAVWRASAPRTFTATGDEVAALQAFDDAMEDFMKGKAINAATLCVAKDGEIKLRRGYTWAPGEFEKTQPCSRLRMASSSKALTAVAIMKLLEGNILTGMKGGGLQALTLDTPVFQINGMPDLPPAYGSIAQQITIRHLLQHRAGWDRNVFEPLYSDLTVAAALNKNVPVSRADMIQFMMTSGLWPVPNNPSSVGYVNFPNTQSTYSNFGFSILAELIEVISGQGYETFVREQVLLPVGANRTRLGRTARLLAWNSPDEVTYTAGYSGDPGWYVSDPSYAGPGNVTAQSRVGLAEPGASFPTTAYGRYNIHTIDAAGGWISTSDDLVRLLASFHLYDPGSVNTHTPLLKWSSLYQMWSNPNNTFPMLGAEYVLGWQKTDLGNITVHYHGGNIDGGLAIICRRSDGVTFAALFSREAGGGAFTALNNVVNTIANWPLNSDEVIVSFPAPSVSDNQDPAPTVICNPPSGSPFPVGTTQVTCQAIDDCTNRSSCIFTVTVKVDDSPPVIECPDSILTFSCDRNGKVVTYPMPTAGDNATSNPVVICNPPSGSQFPIGETDVTCVALDACTNRAICKFSIAVRPDPPPVLVCQEDIRVEGCTTNAIVTYPIPTAVDNDPAQPGITCTPPSGSGFPAGWTLVTCEATDVCGSRSQCTFTVTIEADTTAPTIECPGDINVFTCNPNGTQVQYPAPTANDNKDRNPSVVCTPPSGSVFPIGTTVVACEATDSCTNRSRCTFAVTVETDTIPPIIQCPTNIIVKTCSSNAIVSFPSPTANDDKDRSPTLVCVPPSGSVFPLGNTVVHCEATDDCTNRSTCSFTVTVNRDMTAPVFLVCPSDVARFSCSSTGTVVNYGPSIVEDNLDQNPEVICQPPSFSAFPVGTTIVTCRATDDCGNSSQCTFKVTVVHDTTPPDITCPPDVVVTACHPLGTVIDVDVDADDDWDSTPTLNCEPSQGSVFPMGITKVTCTATDNCGNRSQCSFTVRVQLDTSLPGTDSDGNGLSDIWQVHFNAHGLAPADDTDGDGWSNGQEAVTGTDPQEPSGVWGLRIVFNPNEGDAGVVYLSWPAVAGKRYTIQSSPYLGGFGDYMDDDVPAGAAGPITVRFALDDPRYEHLWSTAFFRFRVQDIDEDQDGITAWEESIVGSSDLTPNTFGNPGGDHQAGLDWIVGNLGPARLREVDLAHIGGSPNGPTQSKLVSAIGTGGWIKLSSWTIQPATHDPVHLQETPAFEGWNAKLHVLEPPITPTLTLNPFVSGRIREDDNLWLTVRRVDAAGAHSLLGTLAYGLNASLRVYDYAMAHRPVTGSGTVVERHVLITPVMGRNTGGQRELRIVTWRITPATGDITALFDTGNLGHSSLPEDGGRLQIVPESPARYVVSYVNRDLQLSSWFFDVSETGVVSARGGGTSGVNIRGNAMDPVGTSDFVLGGLNPAGFVTLLSGTNCSSLFAVWEDRPIGGDPAIVSTPSYITDNTFDLNPNGPGIQIATPITTDSRDDTASADSEFGRALAVGDFNNDGFADVVIGAPKQDVRLVDDTIAGSAGRVTVMYGGNGGLAGVFPDSTWTQDTDGVKGESEIGDVFGHALATGDFNGDGNADLAIGVPFEDIDGLENAGAVNVLYGSSFGLQTTGDQLWYQGVDGLGGTPGADEWFGYTLVAGDFNGDGISDLAIGVPKETVDGAAGAGSVQILYGLDGVGLSATAGPGTQYLHQGIPGLLGDPDPNDGFGFALSAGNINGGQADDLVIGIFGETVNGLINAGAVQIIYGSAPGGLGPQNQLITQGEILPGSDAFPAASEVGDGFGWSVAVGNFGGDDFADVAIAVPFENLENGDIIDAGVVHILRGSANGVIAAGHQLLAQAIPEHGDNFGFTLVAGDFNGDTRLDLSIASLNENVNNNTVTDAGTVEIYHSSNAGLTYDTQMYQGALGSGGFEETAEDFDKLGFALAAGDVNGDGSDDLIVGVPNENLVRKGNDLSNAGVIHAIYSSGAGGLSGDGDQVWAQGEVRRVRALVTDSQWEETFGEGGGELYLRLPPNEPTSVHAASVTKCMTLLLTSEILDLPGINISLNDLVLISANAAGTGGSFMGDKNGNAIIDADERPILEDDQLPLGILMAGMMGPSCNKSSRAIGEFLGVRHSLLVQGQALSTDEAFDYFVELMNAKADALGMDDTEYSHPAHGGVTTPQDLVTLWREGWKHQRFRTFARSTLVYSDCGTDAQGGDICFFVEKGTPWYPGLEGWKGGAVGTTVSGFDVPFCTTCFLGQATRLNRALIVAIQQTGDMGDDTARLWDYGVRLLFTPDHRGGGGMNIPPITDFAVRKIHDTLAVTAIIHSGDQLRLDAWQIVPAIGQAASLNSTAITIQNLQPGTHVVRPASIDAVRLPSIEAHADYLTGHLQGGGLRLELWRILAEP